MRTITPYLPTIVAEVCLTILGALALQHGINGVIFAATLAAIAGLGGYAIKQNHRHAEDQHKSS